MNIAARIPFLLLLASVGSILAACGSISAGPNAGATNVPPAAPTTKPTTGQEIGAVVDNQVVILFPQGGATLTPAANQQLDLAARLFRDANPVVMFTTGYTDQKGDEFSNLVLSGRRAQAVKRGLVARGIPADRLLIQALGESDPKGSDPRSAENRRVVITWRLL